MRNIVVTGGSAGIGKAIAKRFRVDGDDVVITGRRAEPLNRVATELGARPVVCDATDPAQVEALAAQLPEHIDVLVNNAGGNTDIGREYDDLASLAAAWRDNLAANVLSAVLTTSALSGRMGAGGSVVLLGSIAADRGSGGGSYGAAKAALSTWNLDLAAELGKRGITSNVVSPGFVDDTEFFRGRMDDERRANLVGQTRNGRAGQPADVAAAVHFLASEGARHITGQVLNVNGGAWPTR
ncbi:SDR family NAD(P)-dependent oxidoreductase [Kribbella deserti]|uniref:SDR family NAD(P)-dependent oxidoreductase n=1 Tax=Kribbella deserti TaxID=1926257 RepID=A0ABV6QPW4_9ACTN